MEPDQSGGQMDVGLSAEMTRVTEESAGGSGSKQMAMLQMQLRITEMELAMERLRNENGARAAAAVQSTEADQSEGKRLRYTSLLKDILVPMPMQESLVPSWFDDVEATFDCYDVPGEWRAGVSSVEEFRNLVVTDRLRDTMGVEACSFVIQNEAPSKIMLPLEMAELVESFKESRRGMTNSSELARDQSVYEHTHARSVYGCSIIRKHPPRSRAADRQIWQIRTTHMADTQVCAPVPSSAGPSTLSAVSKNVLPTDMADMRTLTCELNASSDSPCNVEQVSMSTRTFTCELDASSSCPSNVKCLRVDLCTDGDAHEWITSYSRTTNTTWIVDRETQNPKRHVHVFISFTSGE
ncbi:hypothetical protein HPB50_012788 [Hyalomma asiaticum]|uniref:Uncharacterized protein n=1 Tax=Hyalomma asiaticum TaxID=266040 RepID=A0ACB7SEZ9_HYAAI|nr:hypothetical protein HPB50_012788 [Hyalomma asiaticum]